MTRSPSLRPTLPGGDKKRGSGSILNKPRPSGRGVEDLTKYRHDEPFFGTTKKGNGPPVFVLFELSTIYATLLLARGLHRIGASALILN